MLLRRKRYSKQECPQKNMKKNLAVDFLMLNTQSNELY